MSPDVLPKSKKPSRKSISYTDQWIQDFNNRKSELLGLAFGDASEDQMRLANDSFRMFHGLSNDPEIYSALIDWAQTGKKPASLSNIDIMHLAEDGFVTFEGKHPTNNTLAVLGIHPIDEDHGFDPNAHDVSCE